MHRIVPYASLQPSGDSVAAYGDSLKQWAVKARAMGYRAAKLECTLGGPYNHSGLQGSDAEMTQIITAIRFFFENPLHVENLEGYATHVWRSPMRIAAGEWLNTRYEFLDLMDRGRVDVAQPDIGASADGPAR